LYDEFWRAKQPPLEEIEVPALVCASWSDQGLHTRGSFEGFARIGSRQKWLYTHGRKKWETYYSADAIETQKRVLDHFVKGIANGWSATPRVRIELRKSYYQQEVRTAEQWPLPETRFTLLYLDASAGALNPAPATGEAVCRYDAARGRASFAISFAE